MKNSKGFTLVELMVGMVILAAAIAGALSFFIFQSQRGHEAFRDKNTDEAVFSALAVMSRDVHAAGFGVVAKYPKLALLVQRTTNLPDALYVSYNEYMDLQYYERDTNLAYLRPNSIFCDGALPIGTAPAYQGYVTLLDPGNLRLYAIPQRNYKEHTNVGAVLVDTDNVSTTNAQANDVNIKGSAFVNRTSPLGTQDWTFPIVSGGVALNNTMHAVPAVSYKIKYYYADGSLYSGSAKPASYTTGAGTIFGSLWRNRGPEGSVTDTGGPFGVPILGWSPQGGNPFINIRDFQVRRQYKDGYWDVRKNSTEVLETAPDPKNVRMLEITLTYQTNIAKDTVQAGSSKPKAIWSQEVTKVIRVSPRHLALLGS